LLAAIPASARIGLAVSGGPDSLALLLLAATERPGQVQAATVDHGLRAEARAEAEAVARICAERGVPHEILTVDVQGSLQAAARSARYSALASWCQAHRLSHLATAHHLDDQAETVLMRLARGAGLAGLSGIRAERALAPGVRLVRPLLGLRKTELEAIVAAAGITPARDPSNDNPRFDRTAARRLLGQTELFDPARIAHSAAILAEAEAALVWATEQIEAERVTPAGLDPSDLPAELVRRLVLRQFARFGVAPGGPELARLIGALEAGRAATLGGVKATPGKLWRFAPAPPRRNRT
jgi:tRNA(Ile)-lysidine synthase